MGALEVVSFSLVLLCLPFFGQAQYEYFENDFQALQSLWGAWNTTPDPEINLAGWHSTYGNNSDFACFNRRYNWRGIQCLRHQNDNATLSSQIDTWIISLSLSDASIRGILPSGVALMYYLVTLTLTGNPNLAGPLPAELGQLSLNALDLHNNNFNGSIPDLVLTLPYLLQLDISGNKFTGPFPAQFGQSGTLLDYSISRNQFSGDIPQQNFENFTQLTTLDISSNGFTGAVPNLNTLTSLNHLDISSNVFNGTLPDLSMLHILNYLNLSSSGLIGSDLSNIFNGTTLPKNLSVLDLSNLTITGSLHDWSFLRNSQSQMEQLFLDNNHINGILDISSLSTLDLIAQKSKDNNSTGVLQILSLRNNSITEVLFDTYLITDAITIFYLQGNPYCTYNPKSEDDAKRCLCTQVCLNLDMRKSVVKVIIIATTVSGAILGAVIIFSTILLHRSRRQLRDIMRKFNEADVNPKRFDYNQIRTATRNFHEDMKLGQGSYGAVYKGVLSNNAVVAVKQLFLKSPRASNDFINEVVLITNLQHRNLVNLKGYCLNGKEMLLIYEYVDNYDLDKILLSSKGKEHWQAMNWQARYKICLGIAHGLYYLHASAQPKIIHRDIKASNILLDKELNPKIADFGLARPFLDGDTEIMTEQLVGTKGYLAPEYMLWGQLSEKADVYSYGVLLLEIVSGKRNIDSNMPEDEVYLPNRAWKLYIEDNLLDLLDPNLHLQKDDEIEVRRVLETALMCIQTKVERRPTMFTVVSMLVGDSDISVVTDDSHKWPDFRSRMGLEGTQTSEEPLFTGPSSSSSTRTLVTNQRKSRATIELSDLDMIMLGGR